MIHAILRFVGWSSVVLIVGGAVLAVFACAMSSRISVKMEDDFGALLLERKK